MFKLENLELATDDIHFINKSSTALDCVAKTWFKKDDQIAICTPLYPGFLSDLTRNGSKVLLMKNDDNMSLLEKALEAKEKGAAGFLVCNPENPTGRVYEKKEIEAVCKWADEHKSFYLIFDE